MTTLLNIGNTFTRFAEWNGGRIVLKELIQSDRVERAMLSEVGPVAVCCVVPAVRKRLGEDNIFYLDSMNCGKTLVDFSQVDTSTLGADRVANALALAALYPLPAVSVDCGTAITLEVVDEKGIFCGGAIAPGRRLMRNALFNGTAQLPNIPFSSDLPEYVGENTVESIQFGVDRGAFGMVRELVKSTVRQFSVNNGKVTVVFTGGDGDFFVNSCEGAISAPEYFTLYGLKLGFDLWKNSR